MPHGGPRTEEEKKIDPFVPFDVFAGGGQTTPAVLETNPDNVFSRVFNPTTLSGTVQDPEGALRALSGGLHTLGALTEATVPTGLDRLPVIGPARISGREITGHPGFAAPDAEVQEVLRHMAGSFGRALSEFSFSDAARTFLLDNAEDIKAIADIHGERPTLEQLAMGVLDISNLIGGPATVMIKTPKEVLLKGPEAVVKLKELMESAIRLRGAAEADKSAELSRRVAEAVQIQEAAPTSRAGFAESQSALAGDLPKPGGLFELEEAGSIEDVLTTADVGELFNYIEQMPRQYFTRLNTANALETLLSGKVPTQGQIGLLEDAFGEGFVEPILKLRSGGEKVTAAVMEVINAPRTLAASYDLSSPFRQGFILGAGHPEEFAKSFWQMMKAASSDKALKAITETRRADPAFSKFVDEWGLYYADTGPSARLADVQEEFIGRMVQKLPVIGKGVEISERAYVTFLNELRYRLMKDAFNEASLVGKPLTEVEGRALAAFFNHATGRGTISNERLNSLMPVVSSVFFSPRLQLSRVQAPVDLLRAPTSRVRKEIARNLVSSVALAVSVLYLVDHRWGDQPEVEVETDARSPDFGRIRIDESRLDVSAGYQPIMRYAWQAITEERKKAGSTAEARFPDAGEELISDVEWQEVVGRFIRSKLAPVPSLVMDIMQGENIVGEPVDVTTPSGVVEQLHETFFPLFFQDVIEAAQEQGLWPGAALGALGGVGFGITTIPTREIEKARRAVLQSKGVDWLSGNGIEMGLEQREQINEFVAGARPWDRVDENIRNLVSAEPEVLQIQQESDAHALRQQTEWGVFKRKLTKHNDLADQRISAAAQDYGYSKDFRDKVTGAHHDRAVLIGEARDDAAELLKTFEDRTPKTDYNYAKDVYRETVNNPAFYDEENQEFDFAGLDKAKGDFKELFGEEMSEAIEADIHRNEHPMVREWREDREALSNYFGVVRNLTKRFGLEAAYEGYLRSADKPTYVRSEKARTPDGRMDLKLLFAMASDIKRETRLADADLFRKLWKWEYIDPDPFVVDKNGQPANWNRTVWSEAYRMRLMQGGEITDRGAIEDPKYRARR